MEGTDRLRNFRNSLKMKQDEMATYLNIGREAYSSIETGKNGIKDEHLYRLLEKGLNLNWLFTGKGDMLLSGNKVEEPLIHIGSVNHGVAGQIIHTNIAACQQEIAALKSENELLRKAVADKETIISLLTNK